MSRIRIDFKNEEYIVTKSSVVAAVKHYASKRDDTLINYIQSHLYIREVQGTQGKKSVMEFYLLRTFTETTKLFVANIMSRTVVQIKDGKFTGKSGNLTGKTVEDGLPLLIASMINNEVIKESNKMVS